MKKYTIHPIIAYIIHLSGMEGAHINELSAILASDCTRIDKKTWKRKNLL